MDVEKNRIMNYQQLCNAKLKEHHAVNYHQLIPPVTWNTETSPYIKVVVCNGKSKKAFEKTMAVVTHGDLCWNKDMLVFEFVTYYDKNNTNSEEHMPTGIELLDSIFKPRPKPRPASLRKSISSAAERAANSVITIEDAAITEDVLITGTDYTILSKATLKELTAKRTPILFIFQYNLLAGEKDKSTYEPLVIHLLSEEALGEAQKLLNQYRGV
jgi:hypothetical protein